jgi:hypothetical protein
MAVDRARLAAELASIMADGADRVDFPVRLCRACVAVLPVDGVGISLMTRAGGPVRATLGASDATADRIEELQYTLGEGPCLSAFADAQPVLVPDLGSAEARARWPVFTRETDGVGAGALFAFPLQVGVIGIGVLDCHRVRAGSLVEVDEALLLADVLTVALLDFQVGDGMAGRDGMGVGSGVDLFDVSWHNHAEVHQATGMIASQLEVSTEVAFVRLRAYAFRHRRPLTAVARDVLGRRLRLD